MMMMMTKLDEAITRLSIEKNTAWADNFKHVLLMFNVHNAILTDIPLHAYTKMELC